MAKFTLNVFGRILEWAVAWVKDEPEDEDIEQQHESDLSSSHERAPQPQTVGFTVAPPYDPYPGEEEE